MSALAAGRNCPQLDGRNGVDTFPILNDEIVYAGGLLAIDYLGEVQMASDTLGLRVIGVAPETKDNADDGLISTAPKGVRLFVNSATYPLTDAHIGKPAYVEDDNVVAAYSTNLVACGLVFAVTSAGVWLDLDPAALAQARANALPVYVAVTGTTSAPTAAQCFAGNVIVTAANSSATTITLPTAIAGYRLGIQRINAGAGYDVILQAPTGDTVLGSVAAGTASNTTDAVSSIVFIETINATAWICANPVAPDRAVWVASA